MASRTVRVGTGVGVVVYVLLVSLFLTQSNMDPVAVVLWMVPIVFGTTYSLGFLYEVGKSARSGVKQIIEEEESMGDALERIVIIVIGLTMMLMAGGLIVLGRSFTEYTAGVLLIGGTLLVSGWILKGVMATRPLNDEEISMCGDGFVSDIKYRVVTGQYGQKPNGLSAGVLPSDSSVLLTEEAFKVFGRVAKRSRVCLWCSQLRGHSSLLFWSIAGAVRQGTTGSTLDRRTSPAEAGVSPLIPPLSSASTGSCSAC